MIWWNFKRILYWYHVFCEIVRKTLKSNGIFPILLNKRDPSTSDIINVVAPSLSMFRKKALTVHVLKKGVAVGINYQQCSPVFSEKAYCFLFYAKEYKKAESLYGLVGPFRASYDPKWNSFLLHTIVRAGTYDPKSGEWGPLVLALTISFAYNNFWSTILCPFAVFLTNILLIPWNFLKTNEGNPFEKK